MGKAGNGQGAGNPAPGRMEPATAVVFSGRARFFFLFLWFGFAMGAFFLAPAGSEKVPARQPSGNEPPLPIRSSRGPVPGFPPPKAQGRVFPESPDQNVPPLPRRPFRIPKPRAEESGSGVKNLRPRVSLLSPTFRQMFRAGDPISIRIETVDPEGEPGQVVAMRDNEVISRSCGGFLETVVKDTTPGWHEFWGYSNDQQNNVGSCPRVIVFVAGRPSKSSDFEIVLGRHLTIPFVSVPPGSFEQAGGGGSVTVTQPFLIGRFEVTRAQFAEVRRRMRATPASDNQADPDGQKPVTSENWNDAVGFCRDLGNLMGFPPCLAATSQGETGWTCSFETMGFRLPTEAEWELAYRGPPGTDFQDWSPEKGMGIPFAWGASDSFVFEKGIPGWGDQWVPGLQMVGLKKPNPLGIHDMMGNAWEMCWDRFQPSRKLEGADPHGPDSGDRRLMKGGSFKGIPPGAAETGGGRSSVFPGYRKWSEKYGDEGFRLVLTLPVLSSDSGRIPMSPDTPIPGKPGMKTMMPRGRVSPAQSGLVVLDLGRNIRVPFGLVPSGTLRVGGPPYMKVSGPSDIRIPRPFLMTRFEITRDQYSMVLAGQKAVPLPGAETGPAPQQGVSWLGAIRFCNLLSQQQGLAPCYSIEPSRVACDFSASGFRLPTRSEWEFARGFEYTSSGFGREKVVIYHDWGRPWEDLPPFDGKWKGPGEAWAGPGPVGSRPPNPLGFFDLEGNLAEWCWDSVPLSPERTAGNRSFGQQDGVEWNADSRVSIIPLPGQASMPASLNPASGSTEILPGNGYPGIGFRVVSSLPVSDANR